MVDKIFWQDYDEKVTPASDDKILLSDSSDADKIKYGKYSNFQGVQGNQGIQGNQGVQGEQGNQGNQGHQGNQGNQGTQGYQGDLSFTNLTDDATGASRTFNNTTTAKLGIQIYANKNCYLTNVNLPSGSTATIAYIYSETGSTLLATSSIVSLNAKFAYRLVAGTKYRILIDSAGSSFTERYQSSASFPYNGTNINYVAYVRTNGTLDTLTVHAINSITTGTNEQGPQGDQGNQGIQGSQGVQGIQGVQGNQGHQGSQGDQGNQGNQGNDANMTGPQGYQGDQGSQGTDGAQGTQGIQGYDGIDGNQGNQGDQGSQGYQGTNGIDGTQGSQGDQGYQGDQGSQGEQGSQGDQGAQGDQGSQGSQGNQGNTDKLTITAVKSANYSANADEYIPCDISGGSFAITLPTAPAEGTRVQVVIAIQGTGMVEVKCGGTDVLTKAGGSTSTYMNLYIENYTFQYTSGIWYVTPTASPSNFATNNPGIDASTPITDADISIDIATKVLTVTPPLGYFYIYTDGAGKITKFRKTGAVAFPAWTDTAGMWYFYFDAIGTATTTQTPWTDFNVTVPVYRILWNKDLFKFTVTAATATLGDTYTNNSSTFTVKETITGGTTLICERTTGTNDPEASGNLTRATGAGTDPIIFSAWAEDVKMVSQYIEYHVNDIPASTHLALHLDGARWAGGLSVASNAIATGTPNPDGRNTVIAISSGTVLDDNLPYTVTNNSTPTANRQQDLGNTTPASLNATNSALFKVYTQNAAGGVSFLPATRFPFAWNATSNRPELISSTGVRTVVTDNRWFVYFVYATQNPISGEAVKTISAPSEFTSLANAQAYTWSSIQSLYPTIFGNDFEIRPLYRIIFYNDNSGGGAYNPGCKYSVIREIQDIRKGSVTSTTAATGSLPASSVTVVPAGNIAATNVQSALEELDTEKQPVMGADDNYVTDAQLVVIGNTSGTNTGDQTIANSSDATSHTVTLSASGGSLKLIEGANITLTTNSNEVTIASTASGGGAYNPSLAQIFF